MFLWPYWNPRHCAGFRPTGADRLWVGCFGRRRTWVGPQYRSSSARVARLTAACSITAKITGTTSAANIRSVLARPLASCMSQPNPREAPTHSTMIAPPAANRWADRAGRRECGCAIWSEPLLRPSLDSVVVGAQQRVEEGGGDRKVYDDQCHCDLLAQPGAEPERQHGGRAKTGIA